jgi:uncharacterized damage-inducible protein DinB
MAPMTIAQSMLEEFERELPTTRKFLGRVPDDAEQLAWRPHEKSMTVGQLALHIAQVPAGVLKLGLEDEAAPPDFSNREQPASVREILMRSTTAPISSARRCRRSTMRACAARGSLFKTAA